MRYAVKKVAHPTYGNQFLPILVDTSNSDLPEPSASLWGFQLWLSYKLNTCKGRLEDLCVFYEYVNRENPLFFECAAKLKLPTSRQINDLASFLMINFEHGVEGGVSVKPSTYNRRIDSIKLFLAFHFNRYIERLDDIGKRHAYNDQMNRLLKLLAKKRYSNSDIENHTDSAKPLNNQQIELIRTVLRPSTDFFINEVNPYRKQLQVRNACLMLLLIELGCRASELILIRNTDSDLKLTMNPTVVIQATNETTETNHRGRMDGASHKTLNRELPISSGLRDLLIEYIEDIRPALRKPFKGHLTDYLFISEKDGGPMTTKGLNHVINSLFKKIPDTANDIHPHQFRVTRGIELRQAVDEDYTDSNSPMIKAGDMQDTMTTWGGWSSTSTQPRRYTNVHIQKKIRDYLANKEQ